VYFAKTSKNLSLDFYAFFFFHVNELLIHI
jgi:hypothetical protein